MAEVLGAVASGITIAALFKGCIDAFDLITIARHQEQDVKRLILRFSIEKARLYHWGQAMGLTAPPMSGQPRPLESSQFQNLVHATLQMILEMFQDSQKMEREYGCKVAPAVNSGMLPIAQADSGDLIESSSAAFSNFNIAGRVCNKLKRFSSQTQWIINDRKKFLTLIVEAKSLIDGLQDITKSLSTSARLEGMMRYAIQQVKDAETLQLIADVSEKDYPDLSDAASIKVDVLTINTNTKAAIEAWANDIGDGLDDETSEIESMTITELKDHLRRTEAAQKYSSASNVHQIVSPVVKDHISGMKLLTAELQGLAKEMDISQIIVDTASEQERLSYEWELKHILSTYSQAERDLKDAISAIPAEAFVRGISIPRSLFDSQGIIDFTAGAVAHALGSRNRHANQVIRWLKEPELSRNHYRRPYV